MCSIISGLKLLAVIYMVIILMHPNSFYQRDCRRPPISKDDPGVKVEEEPLICNHPYVNTVYFLIYFLNIKVDDIQMTNKRRLLPDFLPFDLIAVMANTCC